MKYVVNMALLIFLLFVKVVKTSFQLKRTLHVLESYNVSIFQSLMMSILKMSMKVFLCHCHQEWIVLL